MIELHVIVGRTFIVRWLKTWKAKQLIKKNCIPTQWEEIRIIEIKI